MSLVDYQKQGSIGVITLNNPPVNALSVNKGVVQGILDAFKEGDHDHTVHVDAHHARRFLVLRGRLHGLAHLGAAHEQMQAEHQGKRDSPHQDLAQPQGRLAEGNNLSIFACEVDDRIAGPIKNGFCGTAMFV